MSVPGSQGYEDLRTVKGIVYPAFETSCRQRDLRYYFNHYDQAMDEITQMELLVSQINFFAMPILNNDDIALVLCRGENIRKE